MRRTGATVAARCRPRPQGIWLRGTQPLCIVVGDKPGAFGAYRDGVELYRRAASKDKELVVAEGWSHYDLYDQPEPVAIALNHLIPFYKKYL
ncbi:MULTISPECIES: alpha/beta hydrolase [Nocardia]|uniref:Alpha/beta hydrolase family n=1 Tax=Nocardia africana TaxID=134964 RepID=A0ABW6NI95_9NOCA|nr:alpha/beta hydrolase [Nocardia violaceofusca]